MDLKDALERPFCDPVQSGLVEGEVEQEDLSWPKKIKSQT